MDNFRRRNRDNRYQAVDGIMNSPVRPYNARPQIQGKRSSSMDGLRPSSGRRVDDFKRAEGLHPSSPGGGSVRAGSSRVNEAANDNPLLRTSMLHRTLPGGGVHDGKEKGDGKKHQKQEQQGRWRKVRKWGLRSALALTALVVVLGGFLVFKGILNLNKVFKGGGAAAALERDVRPELLKGEGDGRVNILLLGKGGVGHAGGDLTDTIILASVDPVNKTTSLVSIPRDLWVSVPDYGSSKINAVYANAKARSLNSSPNDEDKAERAGVKAAQRVVGDVLGLPIHYYGMIDFEGFKKAVDIVGGVTIDVPEELAVKEYLWDSTTGRNYYLNVPAGKQKFDSTKALYFARSRKTSARGDFTRTERQRLFIQALGQKVMSAGTYTNPLKVSKLMSAFGNHLSTDLSVNNALRLAEIGEGMDLAKIKSIGLADPPNNYLITDNMNGQSIVRPSAGLGDYSEIHNYIRNTLRDPYIAKENARVAVLNGTSNTGFAAEKADQLKSYGYNVTVVDDAPASDYDRTVFVDLTNGKKPFTRSYLEKRLGVKATTRLPDTAIKTEQIDFVVILGQN